MEFQILDSSQISLLNNSYFWLSVKSDNEREWLGLRQGGLSRNKVSVGEPAGGSPPKKPGAGSLSRLPVANFFFRFFLLKTPQASSVIEEQR